MVRNVVIFLFISTLVSCKQQFMRYGLIDQHKEDLINAKGIKWNIVEAEKELEIYIEESIEYDEEELVEELRHSYKRVLQKLELEEYDSTIYIFLLPNSSMIETLTGYRSNGMAYYNSQIALYVVEDDLTPEYDHELSYIISQDLWGVTEPWLKEGFAVYAVGQWHDYDLHTLAHYIIENKEISLEDLIEDYTEYNSYISNPLAGSFVKFIIERHGLNILKSVWRAKDIISDDKIQEWEMEWRREIQKFSIDGVQYEVR